VANIVGEASQVLQFNRELLQVTFESVSQGIIVVDRELRLVAWNQRYAEMFDYPEGFLKVGKRIAEMIRYNVERGEYGPLNGEQAIGTAVSASLTLFRRDTPYIVERTRSGGTVVEIRGNPMPGGGFVTTYSDITEHKRTEQALQEAKQGLEQRVEARTRELTAANEALRAATGEAERANQSKTRFLAAASHDLLQPLNAAGLFCSALSQRLNQPEDRHLAGNIEAALRSAEGLLSELLDISKLDAGALKPQLSDFDLGELLQELAVEFQLVAQRKGLQLRAVRCRQSVRTDRQLLRRVLQNFLSNAIRYTPRGRVLIGCRRRGETLRVEVWDTGTGIPEDQRQKIFEEFHRIDHHDQGGEKCLGLGLAITERIGRMLGHPIGVRSWPGQGSVFSLTLPRGQARPLPQPAPVRQAPPGALGGLRVLCVDNEPSIVAGMAALLAGWGCRVVAAGGLEEALEALAADGELDAMLVDYRLGGGRNGIDLMDAVRSRLGIEVPGVVITADHGEAIRDAVQSRGYRFMHKPVKPAALRALLSQLCRHRSAAGAA
jgi:signal transduction histidine kinase